MRGSISRCARRRYGYARPAFGAGTCGRSEGSGFDRARTSLDGACFDYARGRCGACSRALEPGTRCAECAPGARPAAAGEARRLKQRQKVLGLLGLLSILTFLDRLAIAVAGPAIQADLHIQPQNWGWILSAYVLANGIFEVPSGAMGDRRGQRGEMTRIVTWWSCFNALTSWSRGFWQLCASRFFFGLGAAGAYPNIAGVIARWFPARERARCQGIVWAASRLGGALAPVLIVPTVHFFGWRTAFRVLALCGFAWAAVWWFRFRNRPQDDPSVTAAELREIGEGHPTHGGDRIPWRRVFRSRA